MRQISSRSQRCIAEALVCAAQTSETSKRPGNGQSATLSRSAFHSPSRARHRRHEVGFGDQRRKPGGAWRHHHRRDAVPRRLELAQIGRLPAAAVIDQHVVEPEIAPDVERGVGERVGGIHQAGIFLDIEPARVKAGFLPRKRSDQHVGLAVEQPQMAVAKRVDDLDGHPRRLAPDRADQRRDQQHALVVIAGDGDVLRRAAGIEGVGLEHLVEHPQHLKRAREDLLAAIGRNLSPALAHEEGIVKAGAQLGDGIAHRRLVDVELFGGGGERAELVHHAQEVQRGKVDAGWIGVGLRHGRTSRWLGALAGAVAGRWLKAGTGIGPGSIEFFDDR